MIKILNWQDPLEIATKIAGSEYDDDFIFLYSGLYDEISSSKSIIALFPIEKLICNNLDEIKHNIEQKTYFGYISYEVVNDIEKISQTKPSFINLPKIHLDHFALTLEFDHQNRSLKANYLDKKYLEDFMNLSGQDINNNLIVAAKTLNSNFSDDQYLQEIEKIRHKISDGSFYQVNLTRKYFGEFENELDQVEAYNFFAKLSKSSPANYSSFLKLNNNFIISSSPELFISRNQSQIKSQPIKGTTPRSNIAKQDNLNKEKLQNSPKERAENLMIVDLVRNDLSRVCLPKSIAVEDLFKISTYSKIHHMSSVVRGTLKPSSTNLDIIKSLFPAGSMTGAPKIAAMNYIAEAERQNRGIYSGAIGYLGQDQVNLSVVIRTLIISKDQFEFQTGGAITFDSKPESELSEILIKAKAISDILGVKL